MPAAQRPATTKVIAGPARSTSAPASRGESGTNRLPTKKLTLVTRPSSSRGTLRWMSVSNSVSDDESARPISAMPANVAGNQTTSPMVSVARPAITSKTYIATPGRATCSCGRRNPPTMRPSPNAAVTAPKVAAPACRVSRTKSGVMTPI